MRLTFAVPYVGCIELILRSIIGLHSDVNWLDTGKFSKERKELDGNNYIPISPVKPQQQIFGNLYGPTKENHWSKVILRLMMTSLNCKIWLVTSCPPSCLHLSPQSLDEMKALDQTRANLYLWTTNFPSMNWKQLLLLLEAVLSPGLDQIDYAIIRSFPSHICSVLLSIFNKIIIQIINKLTGQREQ